MYIYTYINPKPSGQTGLVQIPQAVFIQPQVDAQVFYAEAGLEIRGQWRTADGSTGQLRGTKALAGLALGGAVGTQLGKGKI